MPWPTAAFVIRASFLVVLVPFDVRGFHFVGAREGHGFPSYAARRRQKSHMASKPVASPPPPP